MAIRKRGDKFEINVTKRGVGRFIRIVADAEQASAIESQVKYLFSQGCDLVTVRRTITQLFDNAVDGKPVKLGLTLNEALEKAYIERWRHTTGGNSQSQYTNAKRIVEFFGSDTLLAEVTQAEVKRFIDYCERVLGNQNATINRKVSALSVMFDVAIEDGDVFDVTTKPIMRRRREVRTVNHCYTPEVVASVLKALRNAGKDVAADIIHFLYLTGCRLGEALNLKVRDVNRDHIFIKVKDTAGNKEFRNRTLLLTTEAREILWKYIQFRPQHSTVFATTYDSLMGNWDNYVRPAMGWKTRDHNNIHMLRHSFASLAIRNGMSLEELRVWMGHKTIQTTLRYVHMEGQHLVSARERLNESQKELSGLHGI